MFNMSLPNQLPTKKRSIASLLTFCCLIGIAAVVSILLYAFSQYILNSKADVVANNSANYTIKYQYLTSATSLTRTSVKARLADFIPVDKNNIPFALTTQTYWLIIDIKQHKTTPEKLVVHIDNAMLSVLEIDEININGTLTPRLDLNHIKENKILKRVFPHLLLNFNSLEQKKLLLKIVTDGPPNVPIEIYQAANFVEHIALTQLVFGCFIGIVLLMVIYNFVFYLTIRNNLYLWYIGYLLAVFFTMSTITGFGFYLFTTEVQALLDKFIITLHYALLIFLLMFTLYYLNYHQENRRVFTMGSAISFILLLLAGISSSFDNIFQAQIFFTVLPIYICLLIYLLIKKIKHGLTWSRFYFLSWVPLLIGTIIQPLAHLNIIQSNFLTNHAYLFAVMIEIVFLAFAIAERMKKLQQDQLNNICYHPDTYLPRKSNIEACLLAHSQHSDMPLAVLVIKPEHIKKMSLYVNNYFNSEFFIKLAHSITDVIINNPAVLPLTTKNEKLVYIEPHSLALIFDPALSNEPIETLIKRIQHCVKDSYRIKDLNLPLSLNIGYAFYPEHSRQIPMLIKQASETANKALDSEYGWSKYRPSNLVTNNHLLNIAANLASALEQNEFELFHQPQIDLKTLKVCGSECLLRWYFQGEGFISPRTFIPIAEDIGFIKTLTQWVVKQAFIQQQQIIAAGHKNHMIAINITSHDISDRSFIDFMTSSLEEFQIPAENVVLELAESAYLMNNQTALSVLETLTTLGITISIDNFGTGYSSLAQISELPCRELKIDKSFTSDITHQQQHKLLCQTAINMAKGLKLEVVAQGINSKDDEKILRDLGCDIGQGFLYNKAMPFDYYMVWLEKQINGQLPEDEFI